MPKTPPNPVTPPAREAFVLYLKESASRLGLDDWRIVVSSKPAGKKNMAEVSSRDFEAQLAMVKIGTDFGLQRVDDESLEETAMHEALHIFLTPLIELAKDPKTQDDVLNAAEHSVIHRLVKLLVSK